MSRRRNATAALKTLGIVALAPPVFIGLGLARLAVLSVPFPRLSRHFGRSMGAVALVPLASPADVRNAARIGRVIRAVARRTPWDSNCLAQAVLARVLLGLLRIPYSLHLGLRSASGGADDPIAHAWVACGRVFVTGGNGFANYAVVASFVPAGWVSEATAATPPSRPAINASR